MTMRMTKEYVVQVPAPTQKCGCGRCVIRVPLEYGFAVYCAEDGITFLGIEPYAR